MFSPKSSQFVKEFYRYGYWNIFIGGKYDNAMKIGLVLRLLLYSILAVVALRKIAVDGVQSILNGSLIYVPLLSYTWIIPIMLFLQRRHLSNLLHDLDECWDSLRDESDSVVFRYYDNMLQRYKTYINRATTAQLCFYTVFPIVFDTTFHYVIDVLNRPFIISYPHESFLERNTSWNLNYYAVVVSGWYCIFEIEVALLGWVFLYISVIYYCYPVIVIAKRAVQDMKHHFNQNSIRKAVKAHRLLVKLAVDVKKFFGLPCAFQTTFTSLVLTLTLFTTVGSSDLFVQMAYGSGFILYFLSGLLYCALGQILKNESEELSTAFYDVPWYNLGPVQRKDILMMLRQAQSPFTIDYHGKYSMDYDNFMMILKNAYSFFTLLQTITSQGS